MKLYKLLIIIILLLCLPNLVLGQISGGHIYLELTKLPSNLYEVSPAYYRFVKEALWDKKTNSWSKTKYKVFSEKVYISDEKKEAYIDKNFKECMKQDTSCIMFQFNSDHGINLAHVTNRIIVSKVTKENQSMIIYFFNIKPDLNGSRDVSLTSKGIPANIVHYYSSVKSIFFTNLTFKPGTYFISILDEDTKELKEIIKKGTISFKKQDSLIIDNKYVQSKRIHEKPIPPETVKKYIDNPNLKSPKAINKILSVIRCDNF